MSIEWRCEGQPFPELVAAGYVGLACQESTSLCGYPELVVQACAKKSKWDVSCQGGGRAETHWSQRIPGPHRVDAERS
jgi:hypothetical protein